MPEAFPVVELFGPTIQGEGPLTGVRSHFVRLGGCSFRCTWCDSMHAVDPDRIKHGSLRLQPAGIVAELAKLNPAPWVTLTGGDPVIWDLDELVDLLHGTGYAVTVETQGAYYRDWLKCVDILTCSPKGPSSGMFDRLDWAILNQYRDIKQFKLVFKVVVFDSNDLEFACEIVSKFPHNPVHISAGTAPVNDFDVNPDPVDGVLRRYRWLTEAVLERPTLQNVIVGCQQHVLIWGRELGR